MGVPAQAKRANSLFLCVFVLTRPPVDWVMPSYTHEDGLLFALQLFKCYSLPEHPHRHTRRWCSTKYLGLPVNWPGVSKIPLTTIVFLRFITIQPTNGNNVLPELHKVHQMILIQCPRCYALREQVYTQSSHPRAGFEWLLYATSPKKALMLREVNFICIHMEPWPRYFVKPSVKWCAYYYLWARIFF